MPDERQKILVVDDEPQIARVLRRGLESHGFDVRVANDGESGFDLFQAVHFELIITDLGMPNLSGIELCKRIRQRSRVPVIVLSVKGEEPTKVEALDAGADDYVTKPFGMDELLARVRALIRRVGTSAADSDSPIEIGDFKVEPLLRRVSVRGKEVRLTPKEYDLLLYFISHPDRVLTHKAILAAVWGTNSVGQGEYLRVFVAQLRRKIEINPTAPRYLKTEPLIGYRFQPEP